MWESEIQTIINDTGLVSTIGDLPGNKSNAVALNFYTNGVNTEYFGAQQGSTVFNPVLKVVVRHSSYAEAQTWNDKIQKALHRYYSENILSCLMVGTPMYLGKNEQKLHVFQIVFNIQVKE